MREADDLIITLRSWIKMADEDLRLAEVALSVPDEALHAGICFHSQQCIEKYIKSLVSLSSHPFSKSSRYRRIDRAASTGAEASVSPRRTGTVFRLCNGMPVPGRLASLKPTGGRGGCTYG